MGTFKGMLRPPDQVDGCVKSSPLCAPDVGSCAAQARNRPSWVPRWDVMMGRRRQPATRARERGAQAPAGVHSKRSTAVKSLTVGGSLYEYNAQTLIPLARAATHFWRNLRKFVPCLGNISQPRQPSSAGRGDVSKGTLRPPAQAD